MAAAAAATAKEKAEKKVAKKTTTKKAATKIGKKATKKIAKKKTTKKKASAARRLKVVWKVYNASFKEVGTFAYPQRGEADKAAVKLQEKSGTYHFVNAVKVPLEDEA
jgi:hypothetical protein